ncbi:GTP cyclohydrolase I [Kitasatospora sp. NPDC056076]|uniref:GTP cyclohydrolase I n=1 Tax=Kitasatospora sp. NPDC056076 TaxID=3345703 RepID=UPI0035DB1B66
MSTCIRDGADLDMMADLDAAEKGIEAILRLLGRDPREPGLLRTPKRAVDALLELGTPPDERGPADLLATVFDDVKASDEMVAVGPVPFTSLCEHHLLAFTGRAWVAYIPTGPVVGLSKLPRLVEYMARRPQVQERLTTQITDAIAEYLSPHAACVIRSGHSCMGHRGVRKPEAEMTTSSLLGAFRDDAAARAELFALTRM